MKKLPIQLNRKSIIIIAVSATVVLAGGVGAYLIWFADNQPDPSKAQGQELVNYISSEKFGEKDVEQRQKYIKEVIETARKDNKDRPSPMDLSDQQRKQLIKNMAPLMVKMMEPRINKYFELSPQQQQQRLDQMIDRMEQRRKDHPTGKGRPRGLSPEMLGAFIENVDPKNRARISQFMRQLRERMQQRGLKPPM